MQYTCLFIILGFSLYGTPISYSLPDCNGIPMDQKIHNLLNYDNGVFIEVGAHDGITQSNTKLLEESYGWTGILIEASDVLYQTLCVNRPNSKCFKCALGSFEEDNTFVYGDFGGSLMSSIGSKRRHNHAPQQRVLMRSLQSILDEVGIHHINFFSLDTEGYELNILNGINFDQTEFDYLLIEIYTHQYNEIVHFLSAKGYDLIENFSNYHRSTNPLWDGKHNDYLFKRRDSAGIP